MTTKLKRYDFRIKKIRGKADGSVIIEGYANRAKTDGGEVVVDRGGEYVPPGEWKLDEWLRNPQVFFNHDPNFPIGRGLKAQVKKDGLWVQIQVSNSQDPEVSRIRDLILEGILRTFSAGFDCKEDPQPDGVMVLRQCVLREVSVVSIPMNQESFFEIATKSFFTTPMRQLRSEIMRQKGAKVAALIQDKIGELKDQNRFDEKAFLEEVARISKHPEDEVQAALTGEATAVSDGIIQAVGDLLQIPVDAMREANSEDIRASASGEKPEGDDEPAKDPKDEPLPPGDDEPAAPPDGKNAPLPSEGDRPDEPPAKPEDKPAEDAPAKPAEEPAKPEADPEEPANDPDAEDEDEEVKKHQKAFDELVLRRIPALIDEGKDEGDAIAACLKSWRGVMRQKFKADGLVTSDAWTQIYDAIEGAKAARKRKAAPVPGDLDQGQAATAAQQQTNLLLSQLIIEIQLLRKSVEGMPMQQTELATETAQGASAAAKEPDAGEIQYAAKLLDNVSRLKNNIQQRLNGQG